MPTSLESKVADRLDTIRATGAITAYDLAVADDGVMVSVSAPDQQDAAWVRALVADALAGLVAESQVTVQPH